MNWDLLKEYAADLKYANDAYKEAYETAQAKAQSLADKNQKMVELIAAIESRLEATKKQNTWAEQKRLILGALGMIEEWRK
jgi:hypothetical protein